MAHELQADQIQAHGLQPGGLGSAMAPLAHQPLLIAHPRYRQHLRGEIEAHHLGLGHTLRLSAAIEPLGQRLGAHANGTADVQHPLNRLIQQRLGGAVDGFTQPSLRLLRAELFIGPYPQRHGIGGLLGFSGGLPAEIALLVGMEANPVVLRNAQISRAALLKQRFSGLLQLLAARTPGNAVALGGANDQLARLKEQRTPQQANADQRLDHTAESAAGVRPLGRLGGGVHRQCRGLREVHAQRGLAGIQQRGQFAAPSCCGL